MSFLFLSSSSACGLRVDVRFGYVGVVRLGTGDAGAGERGMVGRSRVTEKGGCSGVREVQLMLADAGG